MNFLAEQKNATNARKKIFGILWKWSPKVSQQGSYFDYWWLNFFFRIDWTHISLKFVLLSPRCLFKGLWGIQGINGVCCIIQQNSSITKCMYNKNSNYSYSQQIVLSSQFFVKNDTTSSFEAMKHAIIPGISSDSENML